MSAEKSAFQPGRVIVRILLIVLAVIAVNDVGRYLIAYSKVINGGRDAADRAIKAAVSGQDGSTVAGQAATEHGVQLDAFSLSAPDRTDAKLVTQYLQTSIKVPGMLIIGPIYAITWSWPLRDWWRAEPVLTYQDTRKVNLNTGGYIQ